MKNVLFWIIAIVITLSSAIYQRMTGPTHPYRGSVEIAGEEISIRLIRSFPRPTDAPARVKVENRDVDGYFRYKRYPSFDKWDTIPLVRAEDHLIAYIPQQPAAGKVMYQIILEKGEEKVKLSEEPIIIRFRDDVPAWALIPHVILMFAAMLFSMRAGIAAIFKERTYRLTIWTLATFVLGGLIFGPIVQKYAFGDWWTGWPFGTDLTDNKTAFSLIFWIIAFFKIRKNPYHRTWVLVASIVLLLIYLIPHSLFGSEIDWTQENMQ
ncbi:MAG: hypothetical protein EA394_03845 [Bacteroidia bacterium]|nr:MAG: hypothetical protein EA394_03845 [Bacteroidia bacterium]